MSTQSVLYKVRRTLGDFGNLFTDRTGGDGVTQVFELTEATIEPTTVVVTLTPAAGGSYTPLIKDTDFTLDARNGVVILKVPPTSDQVLVVSGVSFEDFTDEDLLDYIDTAVGLHTAGRSPLPALDPVANAAPPTLLLGAIEERPVALLAARLAVQDLATQVSKDITIDTGDGTVIPRSQRYQQLVAESQRLDAEYSELVEKLGLPGFDAITMTTLRRVSPLTGRLVPVYRPREWDDRQYPERVLPMVPTGALPADRLIHYAGTFVLGRQYQPNDLVDERGVRYLCLAATEDDPATDVAAGDGRNGTHWQISYINAGQYGYATGAW